MFVCVLISDLIIVFIPLLQPTYTHSSTCKTSYFILKLFYKHVAAKHIFCLPLQLLLYQSRAKVICVSVNIFSTSFYEAVMSNTKFNFLRQNKYKGGRLSSMLDLYYTYKDITQIGDCCCICSL